MECKVTLVQAPLVWEDAKANRLAFEERLLHLQEMTDIIVLPEMFTTGFTMNAEPLAEPMEGPTLAWMQKIAAQKEAIVTGSMIIQEKGHYYNRLLWVEHDGRYQYYDKRHLFTLANEQDHYSPGKDQPVFQWKEWRIFPQICYDLRFPVWARNTMNYDIYLNVANWPQKRAYAWQTLLRARAIENQCFVVAVNRVGNDGKGHYHQGDSVVLDPLGKPVVNLEDRETIKTVTLRHKDLAAIREKLPFLNDRDAFTLSL